MLDIRLYHHPDQLCVLFHALVHLCIIVFTGVTREDRIIAAKTKAQISCAVSAQLIIASVFATR